MRDRHVPRLCRSCDGPMARQADACWRCGTRWATEEEEGATIIRLPVRPMPALLNADVADAPGAWSLAIDRLGNKGGPGADQDRAVVAQRPGGRR